MAGVDYGNPAFERISECDSGPLAHRCFLERDASTDHIRAVKSVLRARRRRDRLFDGEVFADPAWDMLLELYALHLDNRRESISSLCIAAQVPATTALRWIVRLEQDGLAVRSDDPKDGRRSWIELTDKGVERMRGYFEMLAAGGLWI